jgi:hypothetical protein
MSDRENPDRVEGPLRQGRVSHESSGPIVISSPLSELEMAMLEMIDFGIDHWSAVESRDIALGLVKRGLLQPDRAGPDNSGDRFSMTPLGRRSLEAAKTAQNTARTASLRT